MAPKHILNLPRTRKIHMPAAPRRLWPYAMLTALWPIAAVATVLAVAIKQDLVPACVPFWDGCTSISRAGRFGLANLLFKLLMLPYATALAGFWWLCGQWLRHLRPDAPRRVTTLSLLGAIGAVFLALYAGFLGADGELYQWLRRYGITIFFAFSVLAQMLVIALLQAVPAAGRALQQTMLAFAALLLLLGLASLPFQAIGERGDAAINALEWQYALVMCLFYGLIGLAWHRTHFGIATQVME